MLPIVNQIKSCQTDADCTLTQKCIDRKVGVKGCATVITCPNKKKFNWKNFFFTEKKTENEKTKKNEKKAPLTCTTGGVLEIDSFKDYDLTYQFNGQSVQVQAKQCVVKEFTRFQDFDMSSLVMKSSQSGSDFDPQLPVLVFKGGAQFSGSIFYQIPPNSNFLAFNSRRSDPVDSSLWSRFFTRSTFKRDSVSQANVSIVSCQSECNGSFSEVQVSTENINGIFIFYLFLFFIFYFFFLILFKKLGVKSCESIAQSVSQTQSGLSVTLTRSNAGCSGPLSVGAIIGIALGKKKRKKNIKNKKN